MTSSDKAIYVIWAIGAIILGIVSMIAGVWLTAIAMGLLVISCWLSYRSARKKAAQRS
ncbi:hypothetical protein [Arthrobacter russicus]|uniref:ABC-type transport system involved in cytochrome bd biosynthesis fused ATPase/permease subunit n=1 Tax=Arthrobacter russicus TaxID=172040 RepID=A0ABU1J797_9MICC|nr:hypothetical protein [Arthrobacter russicus]MDN5669230.1 intracellular growth attenuator family protein [Renibacterium salmoninarum]MDR6268297.1 ABC-type transport system involved in cytochrome bd biosynthesis fused ATPase/permease subunit [Arthrobacter russicus]